MGLYFCVLLTLVRSIIISMHLNVGYQTQEAELEADLVCKIPSLLFPCSQTDSNYLRVLAIPLTTVFWYLSLLYHPEVLE